MNQIQDCFQHSQPIIGRCINPSCTMFTGCKICFEHSFQPHFNHQYQPINSPPTIMNFQNNNQYQYPNFQNESQNELILRGLNLFDQQFADSVQQFNEHIDDLKQKMKQQYKDYLMSLPNNQIGEVISNPVLPIDQLFQSMISSLVNDFVPNSQNKIDFNTYFQKYSISLPIQKQLQRFIFDREEFENPNVSDLTEEIRERSIIVGQKDQISNTYNGRVLIIYKNQQGFYLGYMKNNKRHGTGTLVKETNSYYIGEFYDNFEWGMGELQFVNQKGYNERYLGYFSQGKRCGVGEVFENSLQQSSPEIHTPIIEYFNNILHGPKLTSKNKFELWQLGQDYFSVEITQNLCNIAVTSKALTSSGKNQNQNSPFQNNQNIQYSYPVQNNNQIFYNSQGNGNNLVPQHVFPPIQYQNNNQINQNIQNNKFNIAPLQNGNNSNFQQIGCKSVIVKELYNQFK